MYLAAHYYTTPDEVLAHLDNGVEVSGGALLMSAESQANDVPFIKGLIRDVSSFIDVNAKTSFVPHYRTYWLRQDRLFDLNTVLLPEMLYVMSIARNGDAAQTEITNEVDEYRDGMAVTPFLRWTGGTFAFEPPASAVYVAGLFCFCPGGTATEQVLQEDIDLNDSDKEIPLTSVAGLHVGEYLRLLNEMLLIEAIDTEENIITVERGANDSPTAVHTGAPLTRFVVTPLVRRIAVEVTAWYYKNRHRVNELYQAPQGGQIKVGGLDPDLWKQLDAFSPISRDINHYRG